MKIKNIQGHQYVQASPVLMQKMLRHIASNVFPLPIRDGEAVHMFRSGARLIYVGRGLWSIGTYASDKSDGLAAMAELWAAHYMHRAAITLANVDKLMQTSTAYRKTWRGMEGQYPNGEHTTTVR